MGQSSTGQRERTGGGQQWQHCRRDESVYQCLHRRATILPACAVEKEDSVALSPQLRHCVAMNVTTIPSDNPSSASTATVKLVRTWVASCNEFRQRERREIIEQEPSPEKLAAYREELKWMIRSARALLSLVSDPDFPARELVAEVSGKLLQLEDSWQSLNNPMTSEEADAVLQKVFPE
jgi:hypothetical protein